MVRAPTNQALYHARLPRKPGCPDVTLLLQRPPKLDFAFLLAQKLPNSYVVYSRDKRTYGGLYINRESYHPRNLDRKTSKTLQKNLVFHEMKVVAFDVLPDVFMDSPCVRLSWSEEKRSGSAVVAERILAVPLMINIIPAFLGIGPPTPVFDQPAVQVLSVKIDEQEPKLIKSPLISEMSFLMGGFVSLALTPIITPLLVPYCDCAERCPTFQPSDWYSPGGWAHCLKKFLKDREVKNLHKKIDPSIKAQRCQAFDEAFEREGFSLQPAPKKAGRKRPNVCLLRDSEGEVFFWADANRKGNRLFRVKSEAERW